MDTKQIGLYLKKQRLDKGISQKELGELLGVTHQAISRWENGTSLPDLIMVEKLATLYSVSIDDILKRTTNHKHDKKISSFIMITMFSILGMIIGIIGFSIASDYSEYTIGISVAFIFIASANIVAITSYYTQYKKVENTKEFFFIFCIADFLIIFLYIFAIATI